MRMDETITARVATNYFLGTGGTTLTSYDNSIISRNVSWFIRLLRFHVITTRSYNFHTMGKDREKDIGALIRKQ